ncbi:predicted protein [Nematostella vectensis]|uniref:Uncharacterized protein n=1 Tax=Nematostella vectensis TaxID=45351 RepID=A7SBL5_NEMVE|nr:predicted protein [Nematostella vectensis]|eukprot:XP_001630953.1 predicted protein [Nematostella vectensis]
MPINWKTNLYASGPHAKGTASRISAKPFDINLRKVERKITALPTDKSNLLSGKNTKEATRFFNLKSLGQHGTCLKEIVNATGLENFENSKQIGPQNTQVKGKEAKRIGLTETIEKERWSHLAKKVDKEQTPGSRSNSFRITADELIARKFTPKSSLNRRQKSEVFLSAVQKFEGTVPDKLLKKENMEKKLEEEKLDFCENELKDMRMFLAQMERDLASIRDQTDSLQDEITEIRVLNTAAEYEDFFEDDDYV